MFCSKTSIFSFNLEDKQGFCLFDLLEDGLRLAKVKPIVGNNSMFFVVNKLETQTDEIFRVRFEVLEHEHSKGMEWVEDGAVYEMIESDIVSI